MDARPTIGQGVPTFEIPRKVWSAQLQDLAERHRGWRTFVEVMGIDVGDQPVLEGLPLQGLTYETKGSEAGGILIEAGDEPDFAIHHVDRPVAVRVAATNPGEELFIQIESRDNTITLIRLHRIGELPPARYHRRDQLRDEMQAINEIPLGRASSSEPEAWGWMLVGIAGGFVGGLLLSALIRPRRRYEWMPYVVQYPSRPE
jgi:hypothetical protein